MYQSFVGLLSKVVTVIAAVGAAMFLALAILVLAPIGFSVVSPLLAFFGASAVLSLMSEARHPLDIGVGRAKWYQVPARQRLEALAERLNVPAMITHKESTEIVFA